MLYSKIPLILIMPLAIYCTGILILNWLNLGGGDDQPLSWKLNEIDLFLLHLMYGRGRLVSAPLSLSYQNITPSIQNFTS